MFNFNVINMVNLLKISPIPAYCAYNYVILLKNFNFISREAWGRPHKYLSLLSTVRTECNSTGSGVDPIKSAGSYSVMGHGIFFMGYAPQDIFRGAFLTGETQKRKIFYFFSMNRKRKFILRFCTLIMG